MKPAEHLPFLNGGVQKNVRIISVLDAVTRDIQRSVRILTAIFVVVGFYEWTGVSSAAAQTQPESALTRQAGTVSIPVIVTDRNYHPLSNLGGNQFELYMDHILTPLVSFSRESGPVSAVLILDTDKSMKSVVRRSGDALPGFLNLAKPGDEYALVLCKKGGPAIIPFTSDLHAFSESFLSAAADGTTPLYDSLDIALDLINQAKNSRRSILVISDGIDGHSHTRFDDLRAKALKSSASVDVLEFWTGHSYDLLEPQPLAELAALTGGLFFNDVSPARFAEYLADLDIRQRYVLTIERPSNALDKKQHQINVRLRNVPKARVFWKHLDIE